ncbi:MAG: hypothetical protein A3C22_03200 [Candidatus Levybacteria bacterium RIFCSPHIGHO2_02_FULL_37_10]|nr:MAG: hypothetical protein A3C22_03200 [Candidatus Levybacteria bacterium RIFCSPHIGHO2_02_FULL_37_10]
MAQLNQNKEENQLITLKIQTKHGFSFNDKIKALTSYNEKGVFDVLPQHENFISVIRNRILIHLADGKDKEIKIGTGVLKVYENEVHIFLEITENT